jgi:hypothetical protein
MRCTWRKSECERLSFSLPVQPRLHADNVTHSHVPPVDNVRKHPRHPSSPSDHRLRLFLDQSRHRNLRALRYCAHITKNELLAPSLRRPTDMRIAADTTTERERTIPCAAPWLHRVQSMAVSRRALLCLLGIVLEQRRKRRYRRHDYAEVVFDSGPHDQAGRVEVIGEVSDGSDAEHLDDCDEYAQSEQAE